MKIDLDYYINGLFYTNKVRPSLKRKFAFEVNSSDKMRFMRGFEFFQLKEDEARAELKNITDDEWNELLVFFNAGGVHFGMTESDCLSYMDADYYAKVAAKAEEARSKAKREEEQVNHDKISKELGEASYDALLAVHALLSKVIEIIEIECPEFAERKLRPRQ